jgi:hypothetical protein
MAHLMTFVRGFSTAVTVNAAIALVAAGLAAATMRSRMPTAIDGPASATSQPRPEPTPAAA